MSKQYRSKINGQVGDNQFVRGELYPEEKLVDVDPNDFELVGDVADDAELGGEGDGVKLPKKAKHLVTKADADADKKLAKKVGTFITVPTVEGDKYFTVDEAYLEAKPDFAEKGLKVGDIVEDNLEEGAEVL